jgi:orotidine-5'-phosphate decarboxylase
MHTEIGRNIHSQLSIRNYQLGIRFEMHFRKKFKSIIRKNNSHLCIGLDSDIKKIPQFLATYTNPVFEFNKLIVECTSDIAAAYKLNTAFYEAAEEIGWTNLRQTVKIMPDEVVTIADAKRGDIENTSEMYAKAFFDEFDFDAITLSPYMGSDSVRPFLRRKNRFVFIIALTSNFGSKDFQFLRTSGKKFLYQEVIEKALKWNDHKTGFVIGANYTKELREITKKYEDVPILVPGIGAQKNSLKQAMSSMQHRMFLVNQSRSIIYSATKAANAKEFQGIIRENAEKARDEINTCSSST